MEKIKNNKPSILFLVLRVLAALLIIAGILFFIVRFNDDYNHDLQIEVGIASPTDEYYSLKLEGKLDNHTSKNVSGTLNVKLKDSKGKITTATFDNVEVKSGDHLEINTTNNSVITYIFDNENGLDYDMKIVEVNVGNVEFLQYTSRPIIAIPLLIGGVGLLLVVQLMATQKVIKNKDAENE